MICAVYGKPGEGMTYEPIQLSAPAAPRGLRLLCLLVPTRDGETRSLPVHTLRPMPPRVCAADSHNQDALKKGTDLLFSQPVSIPIRNKPNPKRKSPANAGLLNLERAKGIEPSS